MNPIRLARIYRRASKFFDLVEQGSKSYERSGSVGKSLIGSKGFWFNLISAGVELAGVLPLPPGTVAAVVAVGNIALRFVTDQPITGVIKPKP